MEKLKSQGEGMKDFMDGLGDGSSWSDIEDYFSKNLNQDPDTGAFWSCFEKSMKSCIPAQYLDNSHASSYSYSYSYSSGDGESAENLKELGKP